MEAARPYLALGLEVGHHLLAPSYSQFLEAVVSPCPLPLTRDGTGLDQESLAHIH